MSYDIYYKLDWEGDSPTKQEAVTALVLAEVAVDPDGVPQRQSIRDFWHQARNRWGQLIGNWMSGFDTPWHNAPFFMARLSRAFPEVTFHLESAGRRPGDLQKQHYRNGNTYQVQGEVIYPKLEPSKLQPVVNKRGAAV